MLFTKTHKNYKYNSKNEDQKRRDYDKINKGKSFLLCFRQAVVMDGCGGADGGGKGNSVVKFVKMDHKDGGVVFSRMYPSLLPQQSSSPSPSVDKDVVGNRKKKTHKKFLRLVKAVLFETSLAKKIRKKAAIKKLKQSKGSDPSIKVEKELKPVKEKSLHLKFAKKSGGTIISNSATVNSCTWLSSTSCASSQNSTKFMESGDEGRSNNSMESNKKTMLEIVQENGTGYYGCNTGLFLLLVALLVLVFWGKLYAILCTSTWLFFVPNWNSRRRLLKNIDNLPPMDSENKKKIIMDGILERKQKPCCLGNRHCDKNNLVEIN